MSVLKELINSDENIWEVEQAITDKQENCISITVGDEEKQFEIVLTEKNLEDLLKASKD